MLTEHFVSKEAKNATLLDEMRAQNGEISLQMKTTLILSYSFVLFLFVFFCQLQSQCMRNLHLLRISHKRNNCL